ncbi:hypothetical protein A3C57_00095 [Candidatus Nomurabacteria bacterium RIFCSPHIGHO2_02_FULL_33_12]|uniref:DUF192 domain-containing protein n=1 Tax=Candidatus Nomurabacteria bacterium RIFCSPLOWO2_01_FULL_33_17 TaxID=1801764 RepID=A0A1F6WR09_9BACT|nr:MAG: hypothetical protein A3C57_00095 [Candidatus Nomurabacteria bacterium RIFCSPHIGHO2_02_FULL_33_12]OGI84286.1 MAG: hypothetical protein A2903_03050 [Candidatus Nomurabacteria bacterium RIFCSPLOWO2_01_FULL_33_17]
MKKIIIFVFLALILGFLFYFFKNDLLKEKVKKIYTPNKIYNVLIAKDLEERRLGLSYTKSLDINTVVLFDLGAPGNYGFWMKDMNYPLDIVFLDENMFVISFIDDADPSSYPRIFYPQSPASFAIEMNAGERMISGLAKNIKVYYK